MGKHREKKYNENIEYNPQNIENVLKKFSELEIYVNDLENSLKAAENKTHIYEDILLKYDRLFKEEINIYRLHKSNISILNQTLNENEIFFSEIQHQIKTFVDTFNTSPKEVTSFKRVFSRFFHQNKLYKSRVAQKLSELNETIDKKNRLLERMHGEIQSWNDQRNTRLLPAQQVSIKQAFG